MYMDHQRPKDIKASISGPASPTSPGTTFDPENAVEIQAMRKAMGDQQGFNRDSMVM